jgi:glycosyltransferase involved in cell wall biosynthesis
VRLLFINLNHSVVYGGVERWMIDSATGLEARGHTCVLAGRPQAPWLRAAAAQGLRVRDDHRGPWAARVLRVRAAMRAVRPDLVITKGKKAARMAAWGRATGGGGRVALFFGLTHELDPRRWIDRFTWRRIDAGIVVASDAGRWYADHGFGPPGKLHVLWKGVDQRQFASADAAAARAHLGLAPDDLAIGTVGRLAWQKGLDDLLAAVRLVRPRLSRVRFFVIGGGRDAPLVQAAAAMPDVAGTVTLLGQRDDVPELLAAMDVVVQSSKREAMAQTTLEAMAAGRAVVSTRTVGADEAIEHGVSGLIVPVGDAPAMAEAIVTLANDPGRRAALGRAAQERIAAHFTQEHALDRCESLFRRLAGLPSPVAPTTRGDLASLHAR